MTKYKIKVPWLNVRRYPVADFKIDNIITVVPQGLVIDVEEVTEYPNPYLGKWFKDSKNQYYNEIGLELFSDTQVAQPIKIDFNTLVNHWWITDYGIDKIWEKTKGAGVKIAVIDSGFDYNHSNVQNKTNIWYYDVVNNTDDRSSCFDKNYYHGTQCAGIISSHGPDVFGVAPDADLLVIKATENGSLNPDKMILALKKAIELKADIISVSYGYKIANKNSAHYIEFLDVIKEANSKNILIVAAVGNNATTNPVSEKYPASFIYSLSVGSVTQEKKLCNYNLNENIDLLAPGKKISVLNPDNTIVAADGTSLSTPFVAGICALYLSLNKGQSIDFLKNTLKNDSENQLEIKSEVSKLTSITIPNLGIINLKNLFKI